LYANLPLRSGWTCDSYEIARISLVRVALCAMGDCGRMVNHANCGRDSTCGTAVPVRCPPRKRGPRAIAGLAEKEH